MNISSSYKKQNLAKTQLQCFAFIMVLNIPLFLLNHELRVHSNLMFHAALFFIGFVDWTFIEYIVHRFWMHGKGNSIYKIASQRHLHHHKHPQDIKITALHRTLMFVLLLLIMGLSWQFNNYFTFFVGFYTGFVWFCYMHLFLHKQWSRRVFKKLVQYHIFHHCKYTEHCHGVSVTWWDELFGTTPPPEAVISDRIINFYFQMQHDEKHK